MTTSQAPVNAAASNEGKHREEFVLQLFRLFKLVTMHQLNNQAVQRSIEAATQSFSAMLMQEQTKLSALFAGENIFVNGQPLKASRGTYESASELGRLFSQVGVNEITIWQEATFTDLMSVLEQYVQARQQRRAEVRGALVVPGRVRLQYVDPTYLLGGDEGELTQEEQILRTYTSAVVVMRRVLEGIGQGRYELMRIVKRIGQRLVTLAQEDDLALIQATALRSHAQDSAERALVAAITAVVSARLLTNDLRALIDIATATLCFDVGHKRLEALKSFEDDPFAIDGLAVELTKQELELEPASAAVALIALAGLYDTSSRRLVQTYEAQSVYANQPLYQGKLGPTLEAVLIAQSHKLQRLLAPDDAGQTANMTLDEILALWRQGHTTRGESAIGRLICTALGIYPRGTFVRLSSGWLAVVLGTANSPSCYNRPMVRLLRDPQGQDERAPRDIHLAVVNPQILQLGHIIEVVHEPPAHMVSLGEQIVQGQWAVPKQVIDAPLKASKPKAESNTAEKTGQPPSGIFKHHTNAGLREPSSAQPGPADEDDQDLDAPDPNTDVLSLTDNHAQKMRLEKLRFLASLDDPQGSDPDPDFF